MSIVKYKNKKSGTTYVYESESYWDKEKKQPRSRRKLIGKLDDVTGEIIPTGKSGRRREFSELEDKSLDPEPITEFLRTLEEKNALIRDLKAENRALKKEKQDLLRALRELYRKNAD